MVINSYNLKAQRASRPTIGFFIANISRAWEELPWLGVVDEAIAQDVNLICFPGGEIHNPHGFFAQPNVLYDLASKEQLDGIVLWHGGIGEYLSNEEMEVFCAQFHPLPIVSIENTIAGIPSVVMDGYQAMQESMNHLIEVHGYQKIGYVLHLGERERFQERFRAYQDSLTSHGIPFDPALVSPPFDPSIPEMLPVFKQWLEAIRPTCQAIAGYSDHIALTLLSALDSMGIRVPEDIAITGFDDVLDVQIVTPPLTVVHPPFYEMGRKGVEVLLNQLAGQPVAEKLVVASGLSVRQSCGCESLAVQQAAQNTSDASGQTCAVLLREKREQILAEMTQSLDGTLHGLTFNWAETLLQCLAVEMSNPAKARFIPALKEMIRESAAVDGDVARWQGVISSLRRAFMPCQSDPAHFHLDGIWQQARIIIGEVMQRAQAFKDLQVAKRDNLLAEIGQKVISTHTVTELMDILSSELPGVGIPSVFLSLYEDPAHPEKQSRLVMGYDQHRADLKLPAEDLIFASPSLAPADFMPHDRPYRMVLEPLYFREEQLGFVLLEIGPRQGKVYDTLRGEISSALQSALLVKRIEERSAELKRQKYILDTFMDSVPDRIYFKDIESRFTRVNKAMLQRTGFASADQMVGKSDFDFFPFEQAQKKFQEEQEIIKSEMPVLSLKEPDGIDLWAATTKMPLRDENGHIIGTFGISRDITELVRASQVAEHAKEEAEEARQRAEAEQKKAEAANRDLAAQIWQTTGQAHLNERMRGEQDIPTLARNVIQFLCQYLNVQIGALYIREDQVLKLSGTYAYKRQALVKDVEIGEGLVGEAALGQKPIIVRVPEKYLSIASSSLGKMTPQNVLFTPFSFDGETVGVIEMGTLAEFQPNHLDFLSKALESVAIAFMTAQARKRVNQLLSQTRQQAEELQAQEEELRATNEELEAQTDSLRASETRLKQNQAALEAANVDLEEKTHVLQEKQSVLDRQNQVLRDAQEDLQRKAEELALASKYKSEFLANMSHELRTPLNSMLILAGMLSKNEEGNLTADQIESAQVIHAGGTDLLNLINEILDLAKVEAGKMEFHFAPMAWKTLITRMASQFDPVAERKGVTFITSIASDLPDTIITDDQRLAQIIKNLLSNAFKFTDTGSVSLAVHHPDAASGYSPADFVAVSVTDTGIGMTPDQQKVVFEAFQQADGSTSRQYGGTGLGLAITREMSHRLGGQVVLQSEHGKGSTFTIYLPLKKQADVVETPKAAPLSAPKKAAHVPQQPSKAVSIPDDRDAFQGSDRILLIVEDDPRFAQVVFDYAHKKSFKCLIASDGETALELLKRYKPHAMVLDLGLPGMSGWEVLDAVTDNPDTRHIPIHIISAHDEDMSAFQRGAMSFLTKPVSQEDLEGTLDKIEQFITSGIKSLLLVEDDDALRMSVRKLIEGSDVAITETSNGQAALAALATHKFDCMILDLSLPDMSGFELLSRLHNNNKLSKCPVIVYTGRALSEEENHELLKYAESVIVKGAKSPERLLDETALFLHRVIADLPEEKQRTIRKLHSQESVLEGKIVLVVDDDTRNAFALSKLLADKGVKVKIAPSAVKALDMLDHSPDANLVLTDIMMPGMDGYDFMRALRAQPRFKKLPIIALTAKAMKGDREKCIEAGASDYLSKPIDPDRLFSMLRVWLSRE